MKITIDKIKVGLFNDVFIYTNSIVFESEYTDGEIEIFKSGKVDTANYNVFSPQQFDEIVRVRSLLIQEANQSKIIA